MAEQEHLEILRRGTEAWNEWRVRNPEVRPKLAGADLSKAHLGVADLSGADLSGARLSDADVRVAVLHGADLSGADLFGANVSGADLTGANLAQAEVAGTTFAYVDLSQTEGLETVKHLGPSTIDIDTLFLSQGRIPEAFLRGAGVPDTFIQYIQSLVVTPIQYYSCFISHSTKDAAFAKRLYDSLQGEGVRCWFAPEDLKIGDRFRGRIDEAIRLYDKLLVVLSENSIASAWVETEVETAFEEERRRKVTVLFPVRLDDAVMETGEAWAAEIRGARHIGDFRNWKNHDSFQTGFDRLLRDLKAGGAPTHSKARTGSHAS